MTTMRSKTPLASDLTQHFSHRFSENTFDDSGADNEKYLTGESVRREVRPGIFKIIDYIDLSSVRIVPEGRVEYTYKKGSPYETSLWLKTPQSDEDVYKLALALYLYEKYPSDSFCYAEINLQGKGQLNYRQGSKFDHLLKERDSKWELTKALNHLNYILKGLANLSYSLDEKSLLALKELEDGHWLDAEAAPALSAGLAIHQDIYLKTEHLNQRGKELREEQRQAEVNGDRSKLALLHLEQTGLLDRSLYIGFQLEETLKQLGPLLAQEQNRLQKILTTRQLELSTIQKQAPFSVDLESNYAHWVRQQFIANLFFDLARLQPEDFAENRGKIQDLKDEARAMLSRLHADSLENNNLFYAETISARLKENGYQRVRLIKDDPQFKLWAQPGTLKNTIGQLRQLRAQLKQEGAIGFDYYLEDPRMRKPWIKKLTQEIRVLCEKGHKDLEEFMQKLELVLEKLEVKISKSALQEAEKLAKRIDVLAYELQIDGSSLKERADRLIQATLHFSHLPQTRLALEREVSLGEDAIKTSLKETGHQDIPYLQEPTAPRVTATHATLYSSAAASSQKAAIDAAKNREGPKPQGIKLSISSKA